jgi:transcriptional regulator with XRE-family HTH domain
MIFNTLISSSAHNLQKVSERALAKRLSLSRTQLRAFKAGQENPRLKTLFRLAQLSGCELEIFFSPQSSGSSEDSIVLASFQIKNQPTQWKTHLMNVVDAFRSSRDRRLLLLPPVSDLDPKMRALMAATTESLCEEIGFTPPHWTSEIKALSRPYFVAGVENLKASALLESPFAFRRRNIFVLENFLSRV